jgi:hypothetical protein
LQILTLSRMIVYYHSHQGLKREDECVLEGV